jgi:peptide/nickel transport system permease protein
MWKYLLRRVVIMVPVMFAVMLMAFVVSRSAPGDPILTAYPQITANKFKQDDRARMRANYENASRSLGLDLPVFYLELSSLAYPDTLHHIVNLRERATFAELAGRNGNWEAINAYRKRINAVEYVVFDDSLKASDAQALAEIRRSVIELAYLSAPEDARMQIHAMDSIGAGDSLLALRLAEPITALGQAFESIFTQAQTWRCYVPTLHWHGAANQFHHWFMRVLRFDFGISYIDRRPVGEKIAEALPWSILMGFFSYIIAFSLAVPIGVFFVRKQDTGQDRVATIFLFTLHSVPTFVMAMVLMTFLCNPDYLYIFPTTGLRDDMHDSYSGAGKLLDIAYHLILPTLLFSYHSVTALSRMMRVSMLDTMHADYIRTARAKGVSERAVIWKHAMRNSLLPIIVSLSDFPPRLIVGAVIVETIFSVPGMGNLVTQAAGMNDHPMIVAVFTISGGLTVLGILFGDVLLALSDPRITFASR